jgi:hypothetical protein
MIVDEIDIECPAILEAKYNAPVGADGNGPESFEITRQLVQPEHRLVHAFDLMRSMQGGQDGPDLDDMLRIDAADVVILEEAPQPLVLEAADHIPPVAH